MNTDSTPAGHRPSVVVVGAGFAGLAAVRRLHKADVDVLLVDRNGYTTFQPLLYQVATGGLNPGDVTFSLRAFTSRYQNTRFRRATVIAVDADARVVTLRGRASNGELLDDDVAYDYLVVGCGVTANYFGIPGAAEHSQTIYTRAGAITARDLVLTALEDATHTGEERSDRTGEERSEPVIVVVGGGATGVEMAGALAELRNQAVPVAYPELDRGRVRVLLVEMADHVLAPFHPTLQEYAAKALRRRGVELHLSTSVKEVSAGAIVVQAEGKDRETLPAAVTIWATGVAAGPVVGGWGLPTGRGGRVVVGPDLSVVGHPEIFAVGDVAGGQQDQLPQLAQPAIQGGRHAGAQIQRLLAGQPTEPFRYRDKGTMATIGRSDAVVQLPLGIRMTGWPAWLAWLALHLVELMGGRNRVASLINLSVRYFSWPRSLNIVVGDPPQ